MDEEEKTKKELNKLFDNTAKKKYIDKSYDDIEYDFSKKINDLDKKKKQWSGIDANGNEKVLGNKGKNIDFQGDVFLKQQGLSIDASNNYSKTVLFDKNIKDREIFNQLVLKSKINLKNIVKFQKYVGNNVELFLEKRDKFKNSILNRVLLLAKQLCMSYGDMSIFQSLSESQLIEKEIELKDKLFERAKLLDDVNGLAEQLGLSLSMFSTMTIEQLKIIKGQLELELKISKTRRDQKQENDISYNVKSATKIKQQNMIGKTIKPVDKKQYFDNYVKNGLNIDLQTSLKKNEQIRDAVYTQKALNIVESKPVAVVNTITTRIGVEKSNVDTDVVNVINVLNENSSFEYDKNLSQTKSINAILPSVNFSTNSKPNIASGFTVEKGVKKTLDDFESKNVEVANKNNGKLQSQTLKSEIIESTVVVFLHDRTQESWSKGYKKAKEILAVAKEFDKRIEKRQIEEDKFDLDFWPKDMIDRVNAQFTKYERVEKKENGVNVIVRKKIIMLHDINEMDIQHFKSGKELAKKNNFKTFSLNSNDVKIENSKDVEFLKQMVKQQSSRIEVKENAVVSIGDSLTTYGKNDVKGVEKQEEIQNMKQMSNVELTTESNAILKDNKIEKSSDLTGLNSFAFSDDGDNLPDIHVVLLSDRTQETWTNGYDYIKYQLGIKSIKHNKKGYFWRVRSKAPVGEDISDLKFWPKDMIDRTNGQLTLYELVNEKGDVLRKEGVLMLHDIDTQKLQNQNLIKTSNDKESNKSNFKTFSLRPSDVKIDSVNNVEYLKKMLKEQEQRNERSKEIIKVNNEEKVVKNKNIVKDMFGHCAHVVVLLKDMSKETWNKMYNKAKDILKISKTDAPNLIKKEEYRLADTISSREQQMAKSDDITHNIGISWQFKNTPVGYRSIAMIHDIDPSDPHNIGGKESKIIPVNGIKLNDANNNVKLKSVLALIAKNTNTAPTSKVKSKEEVSSALGKNIPMGHNKDGYSISFKAMAKNFNSLSKNVKTLDSIKSVQNGYSTFLTGKKIIKELGSIKGRIKTFSSDKGEKNLLKKKNSMGVKGNGRNSSNSGPKLGI